MVLAIAASVGSVKMFADMLLLAGVGVVWNGCKCLMFCGVEIAIIQRFKVMLRTVI